MSLISTCRRFCGGLDNHRQLRPIDSRDGSLIWVDGRQYIDFSSNDYLGLASALSRDDIPYRSGVPSGATGSRLLSGDYVWTHAFEAEIAAALRVEAALIFNSGYQLSVGLVPALVGKSDVVFTDRNIHASWIDGIQLSGAKLVRFSHNDMDHLESRLQSYRAKGKSALIIVESIYSMDGDSPDIDRLVELKGKYDCKLVVDEAHAVGVEGASGLGLVGGGGQAVFVDFVVGTFGKALAGFGAYVGCSAVDRHFLIQHCRSFIFSTALPPSIIFQNREAFSRVQDASIARGHLLQLTHRLRAELSAAKLKVIPGSSPIIPVIIGDNTKTIAVARGLREAGFWCLPILHPTVPKGQGRIRISLTACHTLEQCRALVATLSKLI